MAGNPTSDFTVPVLQVYMGTANQMQYPGRTLVWSYGGGTQSVAIAVLVAQGKLPKPDWIGIADTGRESSETWEYTDRWVRPMLRRVGLEIEVAAHSLATVDLYSLKGELLIPAFTATGAFDTFCSTEWKKRVVQRRLRQLGYGPANPVVTWIGISLDEIGRCKPSGVDWQLYDWPLVMTNPAQYRSHCYQIVEAAGLPRPPKSSCWMCPYRKNEQWAHQRDNYPQDHELACELNEEIRAKDRSGEVWLHRSRVPLRTADLTVPDQPISPLFGEVEGCDSGMCWV